MSAEGEISAREILKLLQAGKTVTVQVATPVEFSNLRSRLASIKSEEDKIAIGIGLYEEESVPSLNYECRPAFTPANLVGDRLVAAKLESGYECTFRFGERKPVRKYSIVAVD